MTLHRSSAGTVLLGAAAAAGAVLALAAAQPGTSTAAPAGGPTAIDQCKNDGWKAFTDPVFTNQGDCVSHVDASKGGGFTPATPAPAGGPGAGAPPPSAADGTGAGGGPPGGTNGATRPGRPTPPPGGSALPVAGETTVGQVTSGTVTVRQPGATGFTALAAGEVPVGATVDATGGELRVTSELPDGRRQSATLWGGVFTLRQNASSGRVEFRLPAVSRAQCAPAGSPAAAFASAARRSERRLPSLWAKDSHGRYSTRGRNSVATVRGTVWVTRERCEGTFTYVRSGRVDVLDRRTGRRVAVRAGRGYLARG